MMTEQEILRRVVARIQGRDESTAPSIRKALQITPDRLDPADAFPTATPLATYLDTWVVAALDALIQGDVRDAAELVSNVREGDRPDAWSLRERDEAQRAAEAKRFAPLVRACEQLTVGDMRENARVRVVWEALSKL